MKGFKTVLAVDDDIDILEIIKNILDGEGYQVITARNKEEGLQKAKEHNPDLAILDVMMTYEYEGFELAKTLTDKQEFGDIPILMNTSVDFLTTTRVDVAAMAREYRKDPNFEDLEVLLVKDITTGTAGVDYKVPNGDSVFFPVNGFLRKPINPEVLKNEIDRLLNN